jgi:hypothetical protein
MRDDISNGSSLGAIIFFIAWCCVGRIGLIDTKAQDHAVSDFRMSLVTSPPPL